MPALIHLIYSSAATMEFGKDDLAKLLEKSRQSNGARGVTGMLLHVDGSFLQVLEGEPEVVEELFALISTDRRHAKISTIIREPIPRRAFTDWSMGYAEVTTDELASLDGINDFFATGACFTDLTPGRTKKLLAAFKEGRWRSRLDGPGAAATTMVPAKAPERPEPSTAAPVSFAFQPIIDGSARTIVSYEALLRDLRGDEPTHERDRNPSASDKARFETDALVLAIELASRLGLTGGLHLNYSVHRVAEAEATLRSTLDAAERCGIAPDRLTLEIDQDDLVDDAEWFAAMIQEHRGVGLRVSIDHFGAGRSGLQLIESHQPDSVALNEVLVRGIDGHGARQAIVRGVIQTCGDLGIDVIAKHVETEDEYWWCRHEGIELFQGPLIGAPAFEWLPTVAHFPAVAEA